MRIVVELKRDATPAVVLQSNSTVIRNCKTPLAPTWWALIPEDGKYVPMRPDAERHVDAVHHSSEGSCHAVESRLISIDAEARLHLVEGLQLAIDPH